MLALAALLLAVSLAALLLGARLADAAQRVMVAPGDERALVGFHERERNPLGAYRWSRPGAALFLYGLDGRPALVSLRLNASPPPGAPPATLAPRVGARRLGGFTVGTAWRRYQFLAPTNPTGDTALYLDGNTFRPAGDERDLGVALAAADSRPAVVEGFLPPLPRAIFLVTLPLLAWLALRLSDDRRPTTDDRRPTRGRSQRSVVRGRWSVVGGPWSLAAGLALTPLVAWAAARPAEAGYWLPTFGWPWWPLAPLTLLVIADCRLQIADWRWRNPQSAMFNLQSAIPGERWLLAGITLLALGLRLYGLNDLPQGLWRDEARHGLIALEIWRDPTYRPVYVVQGADLPALLFYLMAPVVGLLGPGVASVRLVSALAGALTPLALWWAARPLVGPRAALLGAALLAWSSWSLSMSRWAFPATLDQLLTLAAVGFALRALASVERSTFDVRRSTFDVQLALAGALAGLAAYTYHTGRLAPLLLAGVTAAWLGRERTAWRRAAPGLAAAALAGVLVLTPLLRFVGQDFRGYNRRTGAVAFYNDQDAGVHAPLLLLLRNGGCYLLMWHVAGDRNARHHAPGAPMLDPAAGALLALGIALALLARRERPARVLLAWLALGLLPGVLSTGAPHAMRALPALAPACVLVGAALAWLTRRTPPHRWSLVVGRWSLVGLALASSFGLSAWLYFVQMPHDPRRQEAFDTPETIMGQLARAAQTAADPALRQVRVFLPSGAHASDVVVFLTADVEAGAFDLEAGLSAPPGGQALVLLPAGAPAELRRAALAALGPGARELRGPQEPDGRPILLAYGLGDAAARLLEEVAGRRSDPAEGRQQRGIISAVARPGAARHVNRISGRRARCSSRCSTAASRC
jgi:4-amino-4-deoxy-L-arabinose transferase-like glycosyltransferase